VTATSETRPRRRLLMVSPHFPPDTSAGTHRVRLLAPHLPACGWEPTVVTVDPGDHEGRLDPDLLALVPADLRVVRARALPPRLTRLLGLGDLGLRALPGLARVCRRLLARERFDALFITLYPVYPALLGPWLRRRFRLPFVLDYQDPWVGSWGETVGGGPGGRPDLKSRLSRRLGAFLEPRILARADGLTAVSRGTWEEIFTRHPELSTLPTAELPLGGEASDFEAVEGVSRSDDPFDPTDGKVHLVYVGTLLPLGFATLDALLRAVGRLRASAPELYGRLRLHFFGTSNQTRPDAPERVLPLARELGVADAVTEVAPRIDYLDALGVLTRASGILLLGSSEPHYTASKLYPALLARRPLLAACHRASSVHEILGRIAREPTVRRVTYGDSSPEESLGEEVIRALAQNLRELVEAPLYRPEDVDLEGLEEFSARAVAGRLGAFLDRLVDGGVR